ncbi:MAG: NADH:flavin oxidoreductase [Synergistes sp.]|nr:NADH:flavin oxidoreductase [Synergistes sp.]
MREEKNKDKIIALFKPFENSVFPVKNRFVRAATYLAACTDEGRATPLSISRQAETAAGGAGTVISEYAYISPEGKSSPRQWGIYDDRSVEDVRRLSSAIHAAGSKLVVQICHTGGSRNPAVESPLPALSPSGEYPVAGCTSRAMKEEDIEKVIRDFAAAAKRAKEGGADGVEIHGAHGFLLMQFLSPLINHREDRWGGCFENRVRMLREVYAAVRGAVGEDFPVWAKISSREGIKGGYTSDEGVEASLTLLRDGVDVIEVSSGAGYSDAHYIPSVVGVSAGDSEAPSAENAVRIRAAAPKSSLVTLTGGLRSLPVIAALLEDGAADLFGISRPFIAEPDLINRWAEDDSRPAACISCNACFKTAAYGAIDCPIMRNRQEGNWDPL